MRRGTSEKALQRRVLEALRKRGGWWRKSATLPYGSTGDPDIYGCRSGQFVAIELKAPGKYRTPEDGLTALQAATLDQLRNQGAAVLVTDNFEEVFTWLSALGL